MSTLPISMVQPQKPTPSVAYLQGVQDLRGEIESAMLAISGNRLSVLEQSLWRQQVLCTSLKHLSGQLSVDSVDRTLKHRLEEANVALQEVHRTYALLIAQSSQSNDLLLRLCRSYKDAAPIPVTHDRPGSWSCEA